MRTAHYDLIVVGLGAMGSAALYQASKRGLRTLGIDRFDPPHNMGSSHGETRITRQSIGEGEMYMPFIRRSDEIWRELESISGRKLFLQSGGLIIAPETDAASFHVQGDFVEAFGSTWLRNLASRTKCWTLLPSTQRFPLLDAASGRSCLL